MGTKSADMASAPLPAISGLVAACPCADYIGDALRSLQAQTLSDREAIVVVDGSPDDLAAALPDDLAAALQDGGGWSTDLRTAEDLDLWIRLLERGWQCVFIPRPLHHDRRRPDSLSSANLSLLMGVAKVYDGAIARLAGRPNKAPR